MNEYKDISDTRYVIKRVFSNVETPATLIEQRILNNKNRILPLAESGGTVYNNVSGSIQSKEVK